MMLETNNISFIALSLMLLSFFYYVYSINIKKNLMKFIGSIVLLASVSIISSMLIHNGLLSICLLGLCLILFKQDSLLECLFISLYFIFLKVLTYVIMTWGINIFIYDLVYLFMIQSMVQISFYVYFYFLQGIYLRIIYCVLKNIPLSILVSILF